MMERKLIISEQPRCKSCGKLMQEWNPFAELHEHSECTAKRISVKLIENLKNQLNNK